MSAIRRLNHGLLGPPAAEGACVINSSGVGVTTPTLAAAIRTYAIDVTVNREYVTGDTGDVDWLYGISDGGIPTCAFGSATVSLIGETAVFWFTTPVGIMTTGVNATIPAGRQTFVFVGKDARQDWNGRRIYHNGTSDYITNILFDGTGNNSNQVNTPSSTYTIGGRPANGDAVSQIHRFVTDTVEWGEAHALDFHNGNLPSTGGTQYEAPCPFV